MQHYLFTNHVFYSSTISIFYFFSRLHRFPTTWPRQSSTTTSRPNLLLGYVYLLFIDHAHLLLLGHAHLLGQSHLVRLISDRVRYMAHILCLPPSQIICIPLILSARWEVKNCTQFATSATVPILPIGIVLLEFSKYCVTGCSMIVQLGVGANGAWLLSSRGKAISSGGEFAFIGKREWY